MEKDVNPLQNKATGNQNPFREKGSGLPKAFTIVLLCLVTLMTYKFVAWNWWKIQRAAIMVKGIIKAQPAVNLEITFQNNTIFYKSFPYNTRGNYYLINQFDVSPYKSQVSRNSLYFRVNKRPPQKPLLFTTETFSIAKIESAYFIFTRGHCSIEDFLRLKAFLPLMGQTYLWLSQQCSHI